MTRLLQCSLPVLIFLFGILSCSNQLETDAKHRRPFHIQRDIKDSLFLPFLEALFQCEKSRLHAVFAQELNSFYVGNHLPPSDDLSEHWLKIKFYHLLFTANGAVDGNRSGILQIPYAWHWINPNPRLEIFQKNGTLLKNAKPQKGYERYTNAAMIDRLPDVFLGDLAKDSVNYSHPDWGHFATFGWCSEREMSFSLLMNKLGYQTKIVTSGNHCYSEILFPLKDGSNQYFQVKVDNTFAGYAWVKAANLIPKDWAAATGTDKTQRFYNAMTVDKTQMTKLSYLKLSSKSKKAILRKVDLYFAGF